ncbi:hypothetical protein GPL26_16410 [Enterocloster citroniae]|uniref:Uncharacterized protein n=1 Tax=Enterocloster citroniae TaxID=358743 RepID=A0AA41K7G8_9FIRM|nr:hypothetical protein [Enterocloster citroniae]MBT9811209.1 hypothetical protein [Enterocloster citroniae]
MANVTEIRMNNVPVDLFLQGQMAVERINAVQEYVNSAKYTDDNVIFSILGVKKKEQQEAGNDASVPL